MPRKKYVIKNNFGHRPRKSKGFSHWLYSLYTSVFGITNLTKRTQASDLINAISPEKGETVVDFGCSSGYLTMELARYAKYAIGIDINQVSSEVPDDVSDKIEFRSYNGELESIPLEKGEADKIFVSEVLQAIENRVEFLIALKKLLKPGGKLIIVHGGDRPVIRNAYEKKNLIIRMFSSLGAPAYFDKYQERLSEEFRSRLSRFITVDEVLMDIKNSGLAIDFIRNTPSDNVVKVLEWSQYFFSVLFNRARLLNNPLIFSMLYPLCLVGSFFPSQRNLQYCTIFVVRDE